MEQASEAVLALKPVTFRYKEEVDPDRAPQFGLVAEEVEKVDPQLVVHDEEGKPFTVRYEAVNAMLLNVGVGVGVGAFAMAMRHRVPERTQPMQQLKATVAQQHKQIETLTATVQKVSAAVELNKEAPTQVADNR